jgi:hypothetical protein
MTISDSGSDSGGVGADGGGSDPGADVVDPVDRFVRMMDEWIDDCDLEAPRPVLRVDDEFGSGPEALRIGEPEGPLPVDLVEALLARAIHAVEAMQFTKPDSFDRSTLTLMAQGVERLRRQIEAVAVEGADHVDTSNPFRSDGVFTAKNWLQHRLQLSGPEAHRRVQSARMGRRLGHWANAARSGLVGIAQSQLMARVASNPRLDPDVLWRDSWDLLHDAIELSYPMFEQRIRAWEALADPVGASPGGDGPGRGGPGDLRGCDQGSADRHQPLPRCSLPDAIRPAAPPHRRCADRPVGVDPSRRLRLGQRRDRPRTKIPRVHRGVP